MLKQIYPHESVFHRSSESAICYRQRLVVSVGNFQRAKHEMFITAKSARKWVERGSQLKKFRMAPGYRKVQVLWGQMMPRENLRDFVREASPRYEYVANRNLSISDWRYNEFHSSWEVKDSSLRLYVCHHEGREGRSQKERRYLPVINQVAI